MTVTPLAGRLADPAPPEPAAGARCDNCDTALVGPFCHGCGQRDVDHLASVREFLAHVAEVVVGYDSRLWRTVSSLFVRPGVLTAEYIAGRRARYLQPVQLYLAAAALLFIAASFRPIVTFDPKTRAFASSFATLSVRDTLPAAEAARLKAQGTSLEVFAERFGGATTNRLSSFLVVIVPLFALVVAATFLLSRRPFTHHMLFALHWAAFYFTLLAVLQPLSLKRLPPSTSLVAVWLVLSVPCAYLVIALRRAYGGSAVSALVRGLVLYVGFLAIFGNWLQLVTDYSVHHN